MERPREQSGINRGQTPKMAIAREAGPGGDEAKLRAKVADSLESGAASKLDAKPHHDVVTVENELQNPERGYFNNY